MLRVHFSVGGVGFFFLLVRSRCHQRPAVNIISQPGLSVARALGRRPFFLLLLKIFFTEIFWPFASVFVVELQGLGAASGSLVRLHLHSITFNMEMYIDNHYHKLGIGR